MSGQVARAPGGCIPDFDRDRASAMGLLRNREIRPQDVVMLRQLMPVTGAVSREVADVLFEIECSAMPKCTEWTSFFVEAVTAHVVWDMRPTGVINEAQGEWLVHWADKASSVNALALLFNVLSEAHRVPLWFLAVVRSRAGRNWPGVQEARLAALEDMATAA